MADHDTHDHTGIPGVGGTTDLDAILAVSGGQDIADALTGAAAPDAGNVFATIADVGGGGGGDVWLQRVTGNNTSTDLNISSFISSTYDVYMFVFTDIILATNGVSFSMRMGTGGGPTIDTGTNYAWAGFRWNSGGSGVAGAGSGQTFINVDGSSGADGLSNGSTGGLSGVLYMFNPMSTAVHKRTSGKVAYVNSSGSSASGAELHGAYQSTTAVTGVRFFSSSGNIVSGTIDVYGLVHA